MTAHVNCLKEQFHEIFDLQLFHQNVPLGSLTCICLWCFDCSSQITKILNNHDFYVVGYSKRRQ